MAIITKVFSVANITVQASAETVEKRIRRLPGVQSVSVSRKDMTMSVSYEDTLIDEARIIQEVRRSGYQAYTHEMPRVIVHEARKIPLLTKEIRILLALCPVSLLFCIPGFSPWFAFLPLFAVIFLSREIFPAALKEIRELKPADAAISTAAFLVSFIYTADLALPSENLSGLFAFYASAILAGAVLRRRIVYAEKTQSDDSLKRMRTALPASASVQEGHTETLRDIREIKEDQKVLVRPGETICADGEVERGFALVDESAISGQEKPVEKSEGSFVYAGSVCLNGSLEIRVERVGSATAMMRFADLAEKTGSDTSFQSPFKSFGRYLFVYALVTAVLCAFGWYFLSHSLDKAMMVLISVLACPSLQALSLTSQKSLIAAAREAASEHILFTSVEALELAGRCGSVFLDQDNTVTDQELTITDFLAAPNMSMGRLEYIAYALSSRSGSVFARAVTRYLRSRRISAVDAREFSQLSSRGRDALQSMRRCRTYAPEDALDAGIDLSDWNERIAELQSEGKRILLFAEENRIIGLAAARRAVIEEAPQVLQEMKDRGLDVILFTDGTAAEAEWLCNTLQADNTIHLPSSEEKEKLFAHLSTADNVTSYITSVPPAADCRNIDILTMISAGTKYDEKDAGILLSRPKISDFLKAMDCSASLTDEIQNAQMKVIIYHAAAIIITGFLFPAVLHTAVPAVISAAASTFLLYQVVNGKKKDGSSSVREDKV